MFNNLKSKSSNIIRPGFTIVELLIVIVVIGVLAAVTIVSYTGVSRRAVVSSIQSDIASATKQLQVFQVYNASYPSTIDCGIADSATNKCLKFSSGNTATYISDVINGKPVFFLNIKNVNGVSYRATDNSPLAISNDSRKSCYEIMDSGESTGSGIYWISPQDSVMPVYCDMITSGGGWTLILTNSGPNNAWNTTTVRSLNENSPSISSLYSILNKADSIKTDFSGMLNYRIDAESIGRWGGVWEAPITNSFIGTSIVYNATNIEKYDTWTLDTSSVTNNSLSADVMPWIEDSGYKLLTTYDAAGSWWGTMVTTNTSYGRAPYINPQLQTPEIIWYWVR